MAHLDETLGVFQEGKEYLKRGRPSKKNAEKAKEEDKEEEHPAEEEEHEADEKWVNQGQLEWHGECNAHLERQTAITSPLASPLLCTSVKS